MVVIEAEHFSFRTNASDDTHAFYIVPDELTAAQLASPDGTYQHARGGKYMVSLPDSPGGGQNRNNTDLQAAGPYLDFKVQINTPGQYQLYVRALGYDGSSDSAYARIPELEKANGGPGPDWYRFSMNPDENPADFNHLYNFPFDATSAAGWTGNGVPEVNNGGDNGDDAAVVWTIANPGVYTIRWQQREDGNGIDALVFQRSLLAVPAVDVPESPTVPAPAHPLTIVAVGPADGAQNASFQSQILVDFANGTTKLDTNSVTLQIDGAASVKPAILANGDTTFATYQPAAYFQPNSQHTVIASYSDTTGAKSTKTWSFKVQNFAYLSRESAVTPDKTKPGFIVNWSQVASVGSYAQNSIARAEAQLAGLLGDNIADPSVQGPALAPGVALGGSTSPFQFEIPTVINLDKAAGSHGHFTPEDQEPGTPGTTGGTDNQAAELLTYITFPTPGLYTMGFNSDDGFRTTAGNVKDVLAAVFCGQFDNGRGAADTTFVIAVADAGTYPFRTVWENGGGDSNMEW